MSDAPTAPQSLTDEEKKAQFSAALGTVIRLAKELPLAVDPYGRVDIPAPLDETVDVSDHPAIHQAVESFKAAEAEVGIAGAILNIAKQIGEEFGLVIGA